MSAEVKFALNWLSTLLAEETGMDPMVLGPTHLSGALQARLNACGFADIGLYQRRLTTDPFEKELLLAELTVLETWFFRDPSAFDILAREAKKIRGNVKILCAPCSSGEEPYSAAIALKHAGLCDFSIDALDLNAHALDKARKGIYDRHSFRGDALPAEFQKQYFQVAAGENGLDNFLAICDTLKSYISFRQENLHRPATFAPLPEYDFIFCRNLLIYLSPAARATLLKRLSQKLHPGGLLFTGHAELTCAAGNGLQPLEGRGLFALRKIIPEDCA